VTFHVYSELSLLASHPHICLTHTHPLPSNHRHLPLSATQPPRLQRQPLQRQRPRPNKPHKRHHPHHDTYHIDNVISVLLDGADAAAFDTAVFVGFEGAVEERGQGFGGVEFEGEAGRVGGRSAGGAGEVVDEFEDEEAGEGAAEVGDADGGC